MKFHKLTLNGTPAMEDRPDDFAIVGAEQFAAGARPRRVAVELGLAVEPEGVTDGYLGSRVLE